MKQVLIILAICFLVTAHAVTSSRTKMILEIINSIDYDDENYTNSRGNNANTLINESNSNTNKNNNKIMLNDCCETSIEFKSYLTKLSNYF
jgi:hypothetical protein